MKRGRDIGEKRRAGGREMGRKRGGLRGKEREERESRWREGEGERANAAVSSKQ